MTLNDKEIIHKLKIERDYLEAKLHKVNKALEAFGDSSKQSIKHYLGKELTCDSCGKKYVAKRANKKNYCSRDCHPSLIERRAISQEIRKKNKPTTLVKGDALSH